MKKKLNIPMRADKRKSKISRIITFVVLIFAIIAGACTIYLSDYYRADNEAIGAFLKQDITGRRKPTERLCLNPMEQ